MGGRRTGHLRFEPVALYWDEVHYNAAANRYAVAWQLLWSGAPTGPALAQVFRGSVVQAEAYTATVGLLYATFGARPDTILVLQGLFDAGTCFALFGLARALGGVGVGLLALTLAAV